VNSGYPHKELAGKIANMNGYDYPNIKFSVYDGMGSSNPLPFRCNSANFTEDVVYTWQQGTPKNDDAFNITTMNMMNMALQKQVWQGKDYICDQGVGNATCNATFNTAYNSYKQNIYYKNSTFMATNNCGTRIFSHGWGSQSTQVDQDTGLSTGYTAQQTDYLSYKTLQSPHPSGNGEMLDLHPFPALKVVYGMLGATHEIHLGGTRSSFSLNETDFVDLQYPIDASEKTKDITIKHPGTQTERVVVVWVVIIYSLLLIFFIILAVGFAVTIHKSRQADQAKANHVLYDNLNPARTGEGEADEE